MDSFTISLLSGFTGSILGAYVTTRIYTSSKKDTAIEGMIAIVHSIGYQIRYSKDNNNFALIFHQNYSELWSAYTKLNNAIPFSKRSKLKREWRKLMVMEDMFDESNPDFWDAFKKGTHTSTNQSVKCCGEFIKYIEKLR
ncbi:MAG: hypothetical protein COA47_17845 [Robiginitomaculum sp.]|nr:MAG: hypothetical protein COA47_17845 [Robiginitomaculum sp.]